MSKKMDPHEFAARAKRAKVLLLDADGVWFSGHELRAVLPSGEALIIKSRHFHDSMGLAFIRSLGYRVVFVSGEGEPLNSIVEKLNNLSSVKDGTWAPIEVFTNRIKKGDKVSTIEAWFEQHGYTWEQCMYVGDDRNDVEPMRKVLLALCPANARAVAIREAHHILSSNGGEGAIRELADMLCEVHGVDQADLPPS